MITLYTWTTPNGRKISIALEEMELDYEVRPVNLGEGAQFQPDFLAVSPNNKIPAIVDHDAPGAPLSIFESGAILLHLAERTGRFMPDSGPGRAAVQEWLFWQVGGLGPMLGQLFFFATRAPEKIPLAIDRFRDEARRLLGVMDHRLSSHAYLGGAEYSIADISAYPWVAGATGMMGEALRGDGGFEAVDRWLAEIGARPAVQRGMKIPEV